MGRARDAIRSLVANPKVDTLVFGGAIGLDTVCLEAALEFRTDRNRPELMVFVPNRVDDQPAPAARAIRRADVVLEMKNPITASDGYKSFKLRNQRMVEFAGVLVAFWNGDPKTGTGHAVAYARKIGRKVVIITVSGRE